MLDISYNSGYFVHNEPEYIGKKTYNKIFEGLYSDDKPNNIYFLLPEQHIILHSPNCNI